MQEIFLLQQRSRAVLEAAARERIVVRRDGFISRSGFLAALNHPTRFFEERPFSDSAVQAMLAQ
jgi:hypothetical protein